MRDRVATLIRGRRERLARALGHPLAQPEQDDTPLTEAARTHLLEEGRDLYWNELEWEHITEEEATEGPPLSELTFPGLLAFVRGLLLTEVQPDALAPAEPRPQVVEDLMAFLAGRILELEEAINADPPGDELGRLEGELTTTDRLLDLVLYRYHGLADEEVEQVEAARPV
jgi:hypothetical protein